MKTGMNKEKIPIRNIKSAKDIGKVVIQYRKMQKLTQVELAGLAQTGTRFISELENGKGTVQFTKQPPAKDGWVRELGD